MHLISSHQTLLYEIIVHEWGDITTNLSLLISFSFTSFFSDGVSEGQLAETPSCTVFPPLTRELTLLSSRFLIRPAEKLINYAVDCHSKLTIFLTFSSFSPQTRRALATL
jgi:hypothetical protein